jgi:hypothetical protein
MRISLILFCALFFCCIQVFGQDAGNLNTMNAAYIRTITSRAEKIVATLGISDSPKAKQLTSIIADQYKNLNSVYTDRDEQIKNVKQKGQPKEATDTDIKNIETSVEKKTEALHAAFLSALSSKLSEEQVTKVKDGMTYNVLNVTYGAYLDMIPSLTKEQKSQIMTWLVEAREHAMDGESSEKKHWWFGKYKGRINNYLSAQGYDLQKERKEWEERNKQKNKNQN